MYTQKLIILNAGLWFDTNVHCLFVGWHAAVVTWLLVSHVFRLLLVHLVVGLFIAEAK